jgi:hypothetical protein
MATNREDLQRFLKGIARRVRTVTEAYTATLDDDIVLGDATGGAFSITLPTAASAYDVATGTSKELTFVCLTANDVTIDGDDDETINGATTLALSAQYQRVTLVSDGTAWFNA